VARSGLTGAVGAVGKAVGPWAPVAVVRALRQRPATLASNTLRLGAHLALGDWHWLLRI